jgi:hypothetical protein
MLRPAFPDLNSMHSFAIGLGNSIRAMAGKGKRSDETLVGV